MNTNLPHPLCPEVGVIALVPDRWGSEWEPRHLVLSRLATYFHVVWVNYPYTLRNMFSAPWRTNGSANHSPRPSGLQLYQPEFWLPLAGRPQWLGRLTSRQRLRRARRLLLAQGCSKVVLYVWRPEFADSLQHLECDLSVYHIDDEYSFSPVETEISPPERTLLQSAGQVFIHSPGLLAKKGNFNPHTEFVPNGVNYEAYAAPGPEPADLKSIPRPRIGYTGFLKQVLDWQLLLALSDRHPQWSFVFAGGARPHPAILTDLEQMERRPNVHLLGRKATSELTRYPQHFDVCIMPYRMDDYTRYIYPLKMHEYLAGGRPVVSAPIRSVTDFSAVISLATTVDEWSNAIERALSPDENTPARTAERQSVAREHDWDALVSRIARTIAQRLGTELPPSALAKRSQAPSLSCALR
jgi:glycosyltransferase involved in cell wall biosynthesis